VGDPYKPPSAPLDASAAMDRTGKPLCPKCGEAAAKKLSFTFWGGALGPALFNAVKCMNCNTQYNGKTGMPLTRAIILYQLVGLAVVVVLGLAYFALRR
jgi:transposase-like protein